MQHLIINGSFNVSLPAILSFCPNIINLAIQRHSIGNLGVVLQEMSRLTHLAMDLSMHGSSWEFLAHLPELTHICADNAIKDHIPKVFLLCPLLKVFVVASVLCYINLEYLRDLFLVDNNRLVLTVRQSYKDQIVDWERGANGGVDLWIFAERVVFARSSECLFGFLVDLISFRVDILAREIFCNAVTKVDLERPRMGGISE